MGPSMGVGGDGNEPKAGQQERGVNQGLAQRSQPGSREIRVPIAQEEGALEKNQAKGPNRCRTAEPGQQDLGVKGFKEKQEERPEEKGRRVKQDEGESRLKRFLGRRARWLTFHGIPCKSSVGFQDNRCTVA